MLTLPRHSSPDCAQLAPSLFHLRGSCSLFPLPVTSFRFSPVSLPPLTCLLKFINGLPYHSLCPEPNFISLLSTRVSERKRMKERAASSSLYGSTTWFPRRGCERTGCLGPLTCDKDREGRMRPTRNPTLLHLSVKLKMLVATGLATGDGISTRNRCLQDARVNE